MKNDKYLKVILTIIAICLIWICVRDIKIGESKLFASSNISGQQEVYVTEGELDVRIVGSTTTAFFMAEPIQVAVTNWPYSPQPEKR